MRLEFIIDEESAKPVPDSVQGWELRRLRRCKYYYYGRWSDKSPPELEIAAQ